MDTPSPESPDAAELADLASQLETLRTEMLRLEGEARSGIDKVHEAYRESAANLLHYLALRRRDVRALQERLAALGLSSLGRAESHVLSTLDRVLSVLRKLLGHAEPTEAAGRSGVSRQEGRALLEKHSADLLGPRPRARRVRILVTMPAQAAADASLAVDLLLSGMDCARINCAHDDRDAWLGIVENIRRAEVVTGKRCKILMDLSGPKLRTGPVAPGPQVLKWKPRRDAVGKILAPARLWLTPIECPARPSAAADAVLTLPREWLDGLESGDEVKLEDARGRRRRLKVICAVGKSRWVETEQAAYVVPGTELKAVAARGEALPGKARLGEMPSRPQSIVLRRGDRLILTRELTPGAPAVLDGRGELLSPARIGCTLPEAFTCVRPGERVLLDDGKIGGVVRGVGADELHVEITRAGAGGETLRADKGINLPDSDLRLPSLSEKDLQDLSFIVEHADTVGISFVRSAEEVLEIEERLAELGGEKLGIVLKIENRVAFERLPDLLLASMRSPCDGVMIARGDLAVECGFERLAEVQEEILWMCEAAHVPVIWATQVLEGLAKDGFPTRAEITDAAMGNRAECVMLNKGPHIVAAVKALDDILRRMEEHQEKKTSMLRELKIAASFGQP
jgi:pyruvate kinase